MLAGHARRLSAGGPRERAWLGARASDRSPIGVGDGGNEIGMGNVRARLAREGRLMARTASVVPVDHLVVAGVSNWGAYGIVAALGRLTGQPLLHTPVEESRLIDACVKAGAVDGLTRRREPTVDALPLDIHAAVVALLGYHWSVPRRGERSSCEAGSADCADERRRRGRGQTQGDQRGSSWPAEREHGP